MSNEEKPIHLRVPNNLHRTECGIQIGDRPFLSANATTAIVDVTCEQCLKGVYFVYENFCRTVEELGKMRRLPRSSRGFW